MLKYHDLALSKFRSKFSLHLESVFPELGVLMHVTTQVGKVCCHVIKASNAGF